MTRKLLLAYQCLTGLSDTTTGLLLIFFPALTLKLMSLHAPAETLPFLSYIGVFVLAVGVSCLYGLWLVSARIAVEKLEVVWLLTAVTRALVAVFVVGEVLAGRLEHGWITVALTDETFALLQFFGLANGWLKRVQG